MASLTPFQLSSALPCPCVLVVGKSGAGKATLVKRWADALNPNPSKHIVFSLRDSFKDLSGAKEVHKAYDDALVEKALRGSTLHENVIVDASTFDARICAMKNFRALATGTRAFKTSLFLTIPFAMPSALFVPDYICAFQESNAGNVKRLYDQYVAPFVPNVTLVEFTAIMNSLNATTCIVIAPSNKAIYVF